MWYGASLFYRSMQGVDIENEPLWEERIVLIQATDADAARVAAERAGRDGEVSHLTLHDGEVGWVFETVNRLYEVPERSLGHGVTVFSRFLRQSDARSMRKPIEHAR